MLGACLCTQPRAQMAFPMVMSSGKRKKRQTKDSRGSKDYMASQWKERFVPEVSEKSTGSQSESRAHSTTGDKGTSRAWAASATSVIFYQGDGTEASTVSESFSASGANGAWSCAASKTRSIITSK